MPTAAPKPCLRPLCAAYAVPGRAYCASHLPAVNVERRTFTDANRENSHRRGYNGKWEKARRTFLAHRPQCAGHGTLKGLCDQPATVVDHIVPHRGNQALFWDVENNWQPLCQTCHNRKSAAERLNCQAVA